ncbi:hypothetical protein Hanom_Chr00s000002g01598641 [Helianthus anomalus]
MKNQKPKFVYRPVINPKPKPPLRSSNRVSTSNSFDALKDDDGDQEGTNVGRIEKKEKQSSDRQDSDEEEVVEVYNETSEFMASGIHPFSSKAGASTSSSKFSNGSAAFLSFEGVSGLWQLYL